MFRPEHAALSAVPISGAAKAVLVAGRFKSGAYHWQVALPDGQQVTIQSPDDLAAGEVWLTIDADTPQVMEITGLSMAAHAQAVVDRAEAEKVLRMLPLKYPEQVSLPGPMPTADQVRIFRVTPVVISVLDYSKGFGHTDLVTC